MTIRWSRRALADLLAIRAYIARDKPRAAVRVATRLRESVKRLEMAPESGRLGRIPGTRELVVPGLPYIFPYRITNKRIQILAVLHGNQQWPSEL